MLFRSIGSVSILKDAAASAIYGARAPYGVMMVTTKMGKRGEKMSVTYSTNFGIVNPVRMPSMTDSYTFALSKNEAMLNSRRAAHFDDEKLDLILGNINNPENYTKEDLISSEGNTWGWGNQSYENNDFIDIWMRSSFRQQHDITMRGGSDKSSYFVSTGYVNQPGTLNFVEDTDNYSRFNINGGIETDVNQWLKFTYRSRYSYSIANEPATEYNAGRSRIYSFAYGAWPVTPVTNPDGYYNEGNRIGSAVNGGTRSNKDHRLDNTLALDMKLAKGLTAHIDGTWRIRLNDWEKHHMPVYGLRPSGDQFIFGGTESSLEKSMALTQYWTVQGYLNYEHKIKKNTFTVQVGSQIEENNYKKISGTAKDLFVLDLPSIAIAQGERTFNDAINDWATVGFFGRLKYNYDDRYLMELNGRRDGSGRYSTGSQWGNFASGSAAWNMSNEGFWDDIKDVVNFAKVRGSYGTLGNQGNSAGYLHVPTMGVTQQIGWIINGSRYPGVNTPGILNMERTWEKITTLDLGAEVKFLDNRLGAEVNYYNRRSWDIIGPPTPKAAVLGASAPSINNAEFVTKGFELQLSWRDMINENWDYGVNVNLSDGRSKITEYNTTTNSISGWYVGKEFGEIWGYESNGLLRADDFGEDGKLLISQNQINANWFVGDVKYEDIDGDGEITPGSSTLEDSGDRKIIGNSTPRYRFGINLALGHQFNNGGRVDCSMFLEGIAKRDLFINDSFYFFGAGNGNSYSVSVYEGEQLDFYRDENSSQRLLDHLGMNTDPHFPRPYDSWEGSKNWQTNSHYLVNGAYIRLKNIQLSYTLPNNLLNKIGLDNCRVYFSGENLFVVSALPSYMDPEFVGGGRMYPQQATYSLGLNIGF